MDTRTVRVPAAVLRRGPGAHDVHAARWASPGEASPGRRSPGVTAVCVHGLGGSHLNWRLMAPLLAEDPSIEAVWAPDLVGFGLTLPRAPGGGERPARLEDNLDLLAGFVRTVSPGRPVLLLGNSMGGLLSLLLAARAPDLVERMVLVNPALPAPLGARLDRQVVANFALFALPGVGERFLALRQRRLTPLQQAEQTMALCVADPSALPDGLLAEHAELVARRRAMPHAHSAFLQAARDVVRAVTFGRGRVWDAVARVAAPTLYVQGAKDRLVHAEAGALLVRHRPDWSHERYEDLGHVPMIEDPARVARDVRGWLARTEQAAGLP